jgi:hypothetical protein
LATSNNRISLPAAAAIIAACALSGVIGGAVTRWFSPSSFSVSYVDFISITLSALGVLITTLGIFIAILSVLGWRSIEDKLRDHSAEFVNNELREGAPLYKAIMQTVREAAYDGIRDIDSEPDAEAGPSPDNGQ